MEQFNNIPLDSQSIRFRFLLAGARANVLVGIVVCIEPNLVLVHANGVAFSVHGILALIHRVRCRAKAPAEPALDGAQLETGE
jgi:hypothetical protein